MLMFTIQVYRLSQQLHMLNIDIKGSRLSLYKYVAPKAGVEN